MATEKLTAEQRAAGLVTVRQHVDHDGETQKLSVHVGGRLVGSWRTPDAAKLAADNVRIAIIRAISDAENNARVEACHFMRQALHEFDHIVHSLEVFGPSMALDDARRGQRIMREGLAAMGSDDAT